MAREWEIILTIEAENISEAVTQVFYPLGEATDMRVVNIHVEEKGV